LNTWEQLISGIQFLSVQNNVEAVCLLFLHVLGKHDVPLAVGYMAICHTERNKNFIKRFLIAFEDVAF